MGTNSNADAAAKAKAAVDAALASAMANPAVQAAMMQAQVKAAAAAANKAISAEAAAKADAAAKAQAQLQAAMDKAAAMKHWQDVDAAIEETLEHAGLSGVDVAVDGSGFAKLTGTVTSESDRDTAVALAEQFSVTGMDVQLQIVPPPPEDKTVVAPTDQPVKYKVKAGESWWGIAQRVYGNGQLWKSLKAANNNPRMIHPGTEIILPPKSALS